MKHEKEIQGHTTSFRSGYLITNKKQEINMKKKLLNTKVAKAFQLISLIFLITATLISCKPVDESSSSLGDYFQDITPPRVTSWNNSPDAVTSYSINSNGTDNSLSEGQPVSVTFSEQMDISSITTNTADRSCSGSIQLSSDNFLTCIQMTADPVDIGGAQKIFSIVPYTRLDNPTSYELKITTEVKDISGNNMLEDWTTDDSINPLILSVSPANAVDSVEIETAITIVFTEPMNAESITVNTINATCDGYNIQITKDNFASCVKIASTSTPSTDNITFEFKPDASLDSSSDYTIKIVGGADGVKDITNGNVLAEDYTSDFQTIYIQWIDSITPNTNAKVATDTDIVITFNKPMLESSLTVKYTGDGSSSDCDDNESIQVSVDNFQNCVRMSATPSSNGDKTVFTVIPDNNELDSTSENYEIKVTEAVKDSTGGNGLDSEYIEDKAFYCADDTDPTISSVSVNNDASSSINLFGTFQTKSVTIHIEATDGIGISGYYVDTTNDEPAVEDEGWVEPDSSTDTISVDPAGELSAGLGDKTFYVWVKDYEGNMASANDSITYSDGLIDLTGDTFSMGYADPDADNAEPVHDVTVDSFLIMDHEVTAAEYEICYDETNDGCGYTAPSTLQDHETHKKSGKENYPINHVTWENAQEFVTWMNSDQSQRTYRLCTESEWEFAARGGTTTAWFFGDVMDNEEYTLWYQDTGNGYPQEVKISTPNEYKIYDMHGNIAEWVEDIWHTSYDCDTGTNEHPTDGSTWTTDNDCDVPDDHVYRGSHYRGQEEETKSGFRKGDLGEADPKAKVTIGFRMCAD